MNTITWDLESNGLLDDSSIDYMASPFRLKPSFKIHCIVVEVHEEEAIYAFYNGDTYILDGREYSEEDVSLGYTYSLKDYKPVEYIHKQLDEFPVFIREKNIKKAIAHNSINFDHLVTKLYFGMDYSVEPDSWAGLPIEIMDTMVYSKVLNADRFGGHSLDNISSKTGQRKIDFRPYVPKDKKFLTFAADMLYYNIIDVKANTQVYNYLKKEQGDWDITDAMNLEKGIAELVTRQEHRGFSFNKKLAEGSVEELDSFMEERRLKVEPILPLRKATKKFLSDMTPPKNQLTISKVSPPKNQLKKDKSYSASFLGFCQKVDADEAGNHKVEIQGNIYQVPLDQSLEFEVERKLTSAMVNYLKKHNGLVNTQRTKVKIKGKVYTLPMDITPIETEMRAEIKDTTHIKDWLCGMGWQPSEYKDKDITVNQKKEKLSKEKYLEAVDRYVNQTLESNFLRDRCEHLRCSPKTLKYTLLRKFDEGRSVKVLTNPNFTVGQDKEICPNLANFSDKFPYVKDVVEYLTYKHRRNSILGGGLDWEDEEEAEKGYLANVRSDGRIATPAATCDCATGRMKHRVVANIPRVTSLYGSNMRALFGVDEGYWQIGFDFDSLEARIESHYCWEHEKDAQKEYCNSLLLAKPNDVHSVMARKITQIINKKFERSPAKSVKYAATYGATAPKIAKTIGVDDKTGKIVFDAFWEAASPLKHLKETLTKKWKTLWNSKYIVGIDGRKVPTRSPHAILNSLFQSTGVTAAKRASLIHEELLKEAGLLVDFFKDDWRNSEYFQSCIMYHDEAQGEVTENLLTDYKEFPFTDEDSKKEAERLAEKYKETQEANTGKIYSDVGHTDGYYYVGYSVAGELAVKAVNMSGQYYKLNVELTAGYMLGKSWKECH